MGNGAVLGFTAQQIDGMSLLEFAWAAHGYSKAQGGEDAAPGLADAELAELSRALDEMPLAGIA